jgi:mycothiol synthase
MRPPTDADIPEILRLVNEHAPEPLAKDVLKQEWSAPRIDVALDGRLEPNGYVLVESLDSTRVWLNVHGRPSPELLDWAETRAAELAPRVLSGAWSTDAHVLGALRQRRFRDVRSAYRMLLDLSEPTGEPQWPDGIDVRTFESGDERTFYDVHQETFRDVWEPIAETYDEWAHWLLAPLTFVPELWFLAHADDEPTGIAICHPHETKPDHGWIRILGVRWPWRGRGLGRALLLHAFREFRQRGLTVAGLGVDATSETGAHLLYQRVGMRVAARFDIVEKSSG